jgi:putative DNA primase/helicase
MATRARLSGRRLLRRRQHHRGRALYRALYPKSPFLFCADDDAYLEAQLNARLRGDFDVAPTSSSRPRAIIALPAPAGNLLVRVQVLEDERGVQGLAGVIEQGERRYPIGCANAGRTKANAAQLEVGNAWVCYPRFKSVVVDMRGQRELSPDPAAPRLTDFNDLHKAEGLEAVRAQILEAIALVAVPAKADAAAKDEERRRATTRSKRKRRRKRRSANSSSASTRSSIATS